MPEYRSLTSISQIAAAIEAGETIEYAEHIGGPWSVLAEKTRILDMKYFLDMKYYKYMALIPTPKFIEKTMYASVYFDYSISQYKYDSITKAIERNNVIGYAEIKFFMKETP